MTTKSSPQALTGQRVRIKQQWCDAGRTGDCLAVVMDLDQPWAVVKWDDEDDPYIHKTDGLEIIPEADRRWPRPWKAKSLMIVDAQGQTVIHLGGLRRDPYEITDLVLLIVEAVNKFSEPQSKS